MGLKLFGSYPNFMDDFWIKFLGPQAIENVSINRRSARSRGELIESTNLTRKRRGGRLELQGRGVSSSFFPGFVVSSL